MNLYHRGLLLLAARGIEHALSRVDSPDQTYIQLVIAIEKDIQVARSGNRGQIRRRLIRAKIRSRLLVQPAPALLSQAGVEMLTLGHSKADRLQDQLNQRYLCHVALGLACLAVDGNTGTTEQKYQETVLEPVSQRLRALLGDQDEGSSDDHFI